MHFCNTLGRYVQLTVNKLCLTNVKELLKHVTSAFNDVVPEEKRRRLTPSDLVDCWSGDIGLNSFQAVEKFVALSHDVNHSASE